VLLPPLRERVNDLSLLADAHLAFFAAQTGKPAKRLSPEALEQMRDYHWPGNLRELRKVIERALILSSGEQIETSDLSETLVKQTEIRLGGKISLADLEDEHIRRVVENSRTLEEAAQILGIDPATLYRKRKKRA
jgi:NtrC-family two-component system response regulator AlgB